MLLRLLIAVLTLTSLIACKKDSDEVGSKDKPLTMYFVPSEDTQGTTISAEKAARYLEKYISQKLYKKDEGFYIKTAVPMSYIAVIEAFGTERADFAALNTFGYILIKDKKNYPAEAILNVVREGNQTSYKAQIIVRADSNIKKLEDLNGKKFAYVDSTSTSGYILPYLLFKEKNINFASTMFAARHDNVVAMVYQGQVDAGATYYSPEHNGKVMDARARVLTQFPDVLKQVKILDFTKEIPNAPFVLRTNLYKDPKKHEQVKQAIQDGFIEYTKTTEGQEVMEKLYSIKGLIKVTDDDFKEMREMFKKINMDLETLL